MVAKPRQSAKKTEKVAAPAAQPESPNVYIGIVMEEGGAMQVSPVENAEVLHYLMQTYKAYGEVLRVDGPRSRTILTPYALIALSQVDAHVFAPTPTAEAAEIVPSEGVEPSGEEAAE